MGLTEREIGLFIEIMKTAVSEDWTPEEVEARYGDCKTLREAVQRSISAVQSAIDDLEDMVAKDLKQLEPKQP